MNRTAIMTAIKTRAELDTGAGGLFEEDEELITGIYWLQAPRSAQYPYITYNEAGVEREVGFTHETADFLIRFNIFINKERNGDPPPEVYDQIARRLYGNWQASGANRVPTYGFHRHILALPEEAKWVGSFMRYENSTDNHTDDVWHFIEEYRLLTSLSQE